MTAPCTNGAQTGARVHCIGQRCLLLAAACVIGGADALLTSPRRGPRRGAALGAKTTQTIYITDGVGDPFPIKPHKPRRAASGKKGFAAAPAAAPTARSQALPLGREEGGKSDGVAVGDVGGGLRGVVATRDFAVGDTVFSVPKAECVLSEGRADASPVAEVWRVLPAPAPHVRVALLLLYIERFERKAWAPLLDVLPSPADLSAPGPMRLWAPAEVAETQDPQLVERVGAQVAADDAAYDDVVVPGWTAADFGDPPTRDAFKIAVATITCRAKGERAAKAQRERSSYMLVPLADLCNHRDPAGSNAAEALAPWGHFVVAARVRAGEEIRVSYGALPNRAPRAVRLPAAARRRRRAPARRRHARWRRAAAADARGAAEAPRAQRRAVDRWQRAGPNLEAAAAALGIDYAALLGRALAACADDAEADEAAAAGGQDPRLAERSRSASRTRRTRRARTPP
ncbi:hypothetical protein JL721_10075 [Aureococcus anophagefferens]|nr:hypothetical protein JL721_10075 [Aureococcus anophagefferens]